MAKNVQEVRVRGVKGFHPNTVIEFTLQGILMSVSLNIEPNMVPFMSHNNVFKGDEFFIYKIRKHIPSECVNRVSMQKVHDVLLNRCMIICREAKQNVLQKEINQISNN